jgi:hypothetical protein
MDIGVCGMTGTNDLLGNGGRLTVMYSFLTGLLLKKVVVSEVLDQMPRTSPSSCCTETRQSGDDEIEGVVGIKTVNFLFLAK